MDAVYADYREMLDKEHLDFVDIATPPVVHLEMVTQAAQRGLPVLCQKPIKDGLLRLITDHGERQFQFWEDSEVQGYQAAQQHFIDCIRTGAEPETLRTMRLVFGAYDSAEKDREYHVGRDSERLE